MTSRRVNALEYVIIPRVEACLALMHSSHFFKFTGCHGAITMFLRWVRTPPMPGIGCLGKFYIRCPGNPKIGIFRFPEMPVFGDLEVGKSENPDFWISGNPDFRKSDFWNSEKPETSDFQVFRFSGVSENRNVEKSGKNASDVEFAHVEFPLQSMVIVL